MKQDLFSPSITYGITNLASVGYMKYNRHPQTVIIQLFAGVFLFWENSIQIVVNKRRMVTSVNIEAAVAHVLDNRQLHQRIHLFFPRLIFSQ